MIKRRSKYYVGLRDEFSVKGVLIKVCGIWSDCDKQIVKCEDETGKHTYQFIRFNDGILSEIFKYEN